MASRRFRDQQRKVEKKTLKRRERLKEKRDRGMGLDLGPGPIPGLVPVDPASGPDANLYKKARDTGHVVVYNPRGELKMSVVLEEFAKPCLEGVTSIEEARKGYMMAIAGWNLALMPEDEQPKLIKQALKSLWFWQRRRVAPAFKDMIDRKNTLFPNVRRVIVDFELRETGTSWHLSVATSLN